MCPKKRPPPKSNKKAKASKTTTKQPTRRPVIKAVTPTVRFVRDANGLKQIVDVTIDNPGPPVDVSLGVRSSARQEIAPVGIVPSGKSTHAVHIPDIRQPVTVLFGLVVGGELCGLHEVEWKPTRHWHVFLENMSHHDVGYTHLPSHVMENQAGYLDQILDFCDETDDFPDESKYRYVAEQSWSLTYFMRNRDQKTVQRLVERMREGRVEALAFFGDQTTGLCSHEELIRLLYPSFALKRKYGVPIRCAEINDVPGLSWGLASILASAGVKYFSFGMPRWYFSPAETSLSVHPLWDEETIFPNGPPGAFWWEGPDGRKVLVWHSLSFPFGKYDQIALGFPDQLAALEKREYPFDAVRFDLCGGGRDNAPPTVEFSYTAREWNNRYEYPKLIIGTDADFFSHIDKNCGDDLLTFRGEVPHTDYAVAATSTARATAVNRLAHDELANAERFAAIASQAADYDYPADQIQKAYEEMLLFDEHTWGMASPAGPAQDAAESEKGNRAFVAAAISHDVQVKSLNRIADHVETRHQGPHVVVFNPLATTRTDVVTLPMQGFRPCSSPTYFGYFGDKTDGPLRRVAGHAIGRTLVNPPEGLDEDKFDLIDVRTGKAVPCQVIELESPLSPVPFAAQRYSLGQTQGRWLKDILFVAENVPPLGYRTYRFVPRKGKKATKTTINVGSSTIENRFFKLKLDAKTGAITSIHDKELDRELVDRDAPHGFNQLVVRNSTDGKVQAAAASKISKGRLGPLSGSLIVTGDGPGCPQRTQEIILYDNIKRIDVANRILKDSTPLQELHFAFPFKLHKPRFQFEASGSVVEPLVDQFPGSNTNTYTAHHYVDVSNDEAGVAWTSREAHTVLLGGLWPLYVSFAHHNVTPPNFGEPFLKPGDPVEGHIYSCVVTTNYCTNFAPAQTGDLLFRYSFTSHEGGRVVGGARDFGWAVSNPLVPVCIDGKQTGPLPPVHSFAEVEPANVILLTLKRAEDGEGLIVRLMETDGRAAEATVRLPFLDIAQAYVTNVVEENRKILRPGRNDLAVPVDAYGITTVRIMPR